mmetsp:Transcript_13576/g.23920  ORF Transcript_13576/g.23920 Transcript_13576/m.23920 type:complete len:247 (+) Transcript_13576:166-906(+)
MIQAFEDHRAATSLTANCLCLVLLPKEARKVLTIWIVLSGEGFFHVLFCVSRECLQSGHDIVETLCISSPCHGTESTQGLQRITSIGRLILLSTPRKHATDASPGLSKETSVSVRSSCHGFPSRLQGCFVASKEILDLRNEKKRADLLLCQACALEEPQRLPSCAQGLAIHLCGDVAVSQEMQGCNLSDDVTLCLQRFKLLFHSLKESEGVEMSSGQRLQGCLATSPVAEIPEDLQGPPSSAFCLQ